MRLGTYFSLKAVQAGLKSKDDLSLKERLEILRDTNDNPATEITSFKVYRDLLEMTLAQFIYLEHELKQEKPSEERLVQLLIRPIDEVEFDDTQESEQAHLDALMELDAGAAFAAIRDLMNNREMVLFTRFDGVIYNRVEPSELDEEDAEEDNSFENNWFFYNIVRTLANEDITKFKEIYSLRMSEVLVEMAYRVQLSIIETARAKERSEERRVGKECRSRWSPYH